MVRAELSVRKCGARDRTLGDGPLLGPRPLYGPVLPRSAARGRRDCMDATRQTVGRASATRKQRDAASRGKAACKYGTDRLGVCMDWRHKHCLSALECSATDALAPDIRIMPISFAQSTHRDVRVKLSSYGHIWSAISTFYLCVVRARLAQLRALPTGARHTAPQQHVVLPRRFGAPPGCSETRNRRGHGERTPGRLRPAAPSPNRERNL